MQRRLNPQEERILKVLLERNYFLTTTQVAEKANISWNTADKYLSRFYNWNWVERRQRGNRVYWRAYR